MAQVLGYVAGESAPRSAQMTTGTGLLGILEVAGVAAPGVDIGDVTVNNTGGASAVNIQDGGNAITVDGSVTLLPATTGGATIYRSIDLDETGQLVSTGAHTLYGYHVINQAAAARYVKIYDHVDAPISTDTPVMTLALAAGASVSASAPLGIAFAVGLGLRATTAIADADVGAPAANDILINLWYK
jgi:hypothetical protein